MLSKVVRLQLKTNRSHESNESPPGSVALQEGVALHCRKALLQLHVQHVTTPPPSVTARPPVFYRSPNDARLMIGRQQPFTAIKFYFLTSPLLLISTLFFPLSLLYCLTSPFQTPEAKFQWTVISPKHPLLHTAHGPNDAAIQLVSPCFMTHSSRRSR